MVSLRSRREVQLTELSRRLCCLARRLGERIRLCLRVRLSPDVFRLLRRVEELSQDEAGSVRSANTWRF